MDTNVSENTRMAGIASGTFYIYYDSKEQLIMEIFLEENVKLKRKTLEAFDADGDPLTVMQGLIRENQNGMNANPILREWYNREVFDKIERHYRQQNGIERVDFLYDSFIQIVERWQAQGKMRADIDSRMIMAMFTAVISLDTHKEEIGIEYFPQVQGHLADFLMQGLTDLSDRSKYRSQ